MGVVGVSFALVAIGIYFSFKKIRSYEDTYHSVFIKLFRTGLIFVFSVPVFSAIGMFLHLALGIGGSADAKLVAGLIWMLFMLITPVWVAWRCIRSYQIIINTE